MRNLTPMLKSILQNSQEARDSDEVLIIEVLRKLGIFMTDAQEEKLKTINFESIRRTRQKLQAQGLYPASPKVARMRRMKGYIMQQNAPIAKPERIEHLVQEVPRAIPWLD